MAYKIYIVEDEPPILRGIIKKITSSGLEFIVCGSAYNGQDALVEIERLKPDVVLTDIRMPVMDGLDLIKEIRYRYPDKLCVILSGYQEFDYARQAVKLGVEDYLIKPVSVETLNSVLNKLIVKLEKTIQGKGFSILSSVLKYELPGSRLMDLGFEGFYMIQMLVGFPLSNNPEDRNYMEEIRNFWAVKDIYSWIKQTGLFKESEYWIINGKYPNEKLLVFAAGREKTFSWTDIERHILSGTSGNIYITAVKSGIVTEAEFERFAEEAENMRKRAIDAARLGCNHVLTLLDSPKREFLHLLTVYSPEEQKLSMFIKNDQYRLLWKEIRLLINSWEEASIPCRILEDNLRFIARLVAKKNNDIEDTERLVQGILCRSGSMEVVRSEFIAAMQEICRKKEEASGKDSYEQVADKVLCYINEKYMQKISLRDIAGEFQLTESYLCKIFKKYKKESPMDYLAKYRIEKAKELLLAYPDMMQKDIAELVGFSDQFYFSRVFKEIVRMNPTEFRASQFK
jgi:two-component system, response regulator YesN